MNLYIHSPTLLSGVVRNYLSTGTTSVFLTSLHPSFTQGKKRRLMRSSCLHQFQLLKKLVDFHEISYDTNATGGHLNVADFNNLKLESAQTSEV